MFGIGGCGPSGRGRGRFMAGSARQLPWFAGGDAWLEGIELSDEQIEKIAELKQKSFPQMAHGRVDKVELMQAIFKELGNPNINRERVAELKGKLKAQKASMLDLMIDNMLALAEILTPEQRKKIRMKKIRQFLGADNHEDEPCHSHDHPRSDHDRHRHHD